MDLGRIYSQRLDGSELFVGCPSGETFDVLEYWRWSASDLVSNASRGILAEFIVGKALGCKLDVRDEWAAIDLWTPEGFGIEVKSSAYLQSWKQAQLSAVSFSCRKARGWDHDTGTEEVDPQRHAHVYVFALLKHQDQLTLNPLDLSQWEFYAVPTAWLDARTRSQHSITLPSLRREFDRLDFSQLPEGVRSAFEEHQRTAGPPA